MSKIRVYELAKELGLDNRVILDMCENLTIEGKKSHSSTLSDDEADRIRRSVLRQAVSEREGLVRRIEREGNVLTERRVGNVIRRRKKDNEEVEEEQEKGPQIDLTNVPRSNFDLPSLVPDHEREQSVRAQALARANALFSERPAEAVETREARETVREMPVRPVEEPSAPAPEPSVEAEPEPREVEVRHTNGGGAAAAREGSTQQTDLGAIRMRHDVRAPKVLGRIDLPQRPEPRRQESERPAAAGAQPATEGGEAAKEKPGGKRKFQVTEDELADYEKPARQKRKKQIVLTKTDLLDYDEDHDSWRGRRDKRRRKGDEKDTAPRATKKIVKIDEQITVQDLAHQMGAKATEVMTHLMNLGVMATMNQLIDYDTASIVANEFGVTITNVGRDDEEYLRSLQAPNPDHERVLRPPVVTIMGHVDHGKTSLLDAIRKTSVTAGEAGGITQHIGAYNVPAPSGGSVTFLDTPGHEAFTAMRMRGAQVTDIVVLVVAADDGVMPQTLEALNHARAANVPIIVAVNKVDKENANPDRVKNQLAEHQLIPEEWGGETIFVNVSAHTKAGIDLLLENLYAQAEVLDLRADPLCDARGTVVESRLDKGRGPIISVLVQDGTLKRSDIFVCGAVFGRVRALAAGDGKTVEEAGPGIPVEILGADAVPDAGDDFYVLPTEADAKAIAERRARSSRMKTIAERAKSAGLGPLTMESFSEMVTSGNVKELPIIIKGDVQGSVEAVSGAIAQLESEAVKTKIIHKGAGAISENDVQLATASGALLIGFNVRADTRASALAELQGIRILYSRIIYELVDAVKQFLLGMEEPELKETTLGRVEVRQTFKVPRLGVIAGSYVLDGTVQRGSLVRLLRDNRVIYEGKMASLRRFKDDVREVAAGYECGIGIEGYNDIKDGDIIEVYKIESIQRGSAMLQ